MKIHLLLFTALVVTNLLGCAQQSVQTPLVAQEVTQEPEPPKTKAFEADTLYALLMAEIAGNRQRYDVSLANYTQQAIQTRDPQVAERAYKIALYLNAKPAITESALLWSEVEPENEEALSAAIFALIDADRLMEALALTRKIKTLDNGALIQNIAASAGSLTFEQRGLLTKHYQQLSAEAPNNTPLRLGYALLLQQQGQLPESLALAEGILKKEPQNTTAAILMSGVMHQLKRSDGAIKRIAKMLAAHPDNTRLRLQYARLLAYTDLEKSQAQFQQLLDAEPHDPDLLLALALVSEERADYSTAQTTYQLLLRYSQHAQGAHFHLGQIALEQEQPKLALKHFLQVNTGNEVIPAIAKILSLYIADGDIISALDHTAYRQAQLPSQASQINLIHGRVLLQFHYLHEAEASLTDTLASDPFNANALYTRSMVYDQLGDISKAEQDLRTLLEAEPENAMALNTLGYVLTERTDRYREAFGYIEQALKIQPADPAIIDSMGWVHYKLGNLTAALGHLERAMNIYPDHEIAAHLGEVQWALGKKKAALVTWKTGLKLSPQSEYILQTLEKLNVNLAP